MTTLVCKSMKCLLRGGGGQLFQAKVFPMIDCACKRQSCIATERFESLHHTVTPLTSSQE